MVPSRLPLSAPTLILLLVGCSGDADPCSGGACPHVPGCETSVTCDAEHLCVEEVCEGVAWICGQSATGDWVWHRSSAPCDDGDPCTANDLCLQGSCRGSPVRCDERPPARCEGTDQLRVFDAPGQCTGGECNYGSQLISCPGGGCADGKCSGAPCTGQTCDEPPGPCFQSPGACDDSTGLCDYQPRAQGTSCVPADPCVTNATCDAQHKCVGQSISCDRPHTKGGTCVQGACQGFQCVTDFGNCNGNWDDGCERDLRSDSSHCGTCHKACTGGANAKVACVAGKCQLSCNAPYQDCDKDPSNGCEIPVGVANRCSRLGLAPFTGATPPCGTAYCGSRPTDEYTQDFGTWYCSFCEHCYNFATGGSWCLFPPPGDGMFSADRCVGCCPTDLPGYPEICPP